MSERPTIEAGARLKAARLRVDSGSERENLPERLEDGRTYRDVRVEWHANAWLDPRLRDHIENEA